MSLSICSCSDKKDNDPDQIDTFDRSEMLTFWADHIIIPAFENYDTSIQELVQAKDGFIQESNLQTLAVVREKWLKAYRDWQSVSMFDIGKAEEIGLRNFVNIYPCNIEEIEEFVSSGNYNLTLPSTFDAQGFPALDYLLFGIEEDDDQLFAALSQQDYRSYLSDLINRLSLLSKEVLTDWTESYRITFIQNDGASATASTDKMVNDFLFYYEKFFRAGKIGIPAGVFTGNPISSAVEAPYSGIYSKSLYISAFEAVQKFFKGTSFDGSLNGPSLQQYLEHVQEANQLLDISNDIINQWNEVSDLSEALNENLRVQVDFDNFEMLLVYDALQKAVVLLKVDMMQAFNIQIDYVDADGD